MKYYIRLVLKHVFMCICAVLLTDFESYGSVYFLRHASNL